MNRAEYRAYLQTEEWRERAESAKQRAGYTCQLCYSTRNLNVHHRTYERIGQEWDEDLIVLCRICHRRHHRVLSHCTIQRRDERRAERRAQLSKDLTDWQADPRGFRLPAAADDQRREQLNDGVLTYRRRHWTDVLFVTCDCAVCRSTVEWLRSHGFSENDIYDTAWRYRRLTPAATSSIKVAP